MLSHDQNINEDQIWTDIILTTCTQLVLCSIEERKNNNQFARYALNFLLLPWVLEKEGEGYKYCDLINDQSRLESSVIVMVSLDDNY